MSWGFSIIDKIANNDFESCILHKDRTIKVAHKNRCKAITKPGKVEYIDQDELILHNPKNSRRYKFNQYKKEVKKITELNSSAITFDKKRGWRDNHIDHIVPIIYGFKNNIPIELMSSVENLQMISCAENMEKGTKITDQAKVLLKKWGYELF